MDNLSELVEAMDNAFVDAIAETHPHVKGWKYKDMPKMLPEYWDQLMTIFGEDNVFHITHATYMHDGILFVRGQILISPHGIENLRNSKLVHPVKP